MEFPAAMDELLPEEMVTEMWVDADNLPRKFVQTIEIPAQAGGDADQSTTEGTYTDFGTGGRHRGAAGDQVSDQGLPGIAEPLAGAVAR